MAKSDSGDSGKQRPPAQPPVPARKPAATASESDRGDTVGRNSSGPTELPAQFGRYRVKKKLGGGGMGTVYLVENTELEREEALKVPHFSDSDDPRLRERFLREAKSAAKLDHPNLCPVIDAGVQDGIYYLTMRFLKGKLLSDYSGKAQPARKAVEIVTKLAQALEAAHAKGVIHRDLKPSNIMMVGGVGPVVMDFGLAKQVKQADQKLTQSGAMLGTPSYMPPEQVSGDLERMGPASDVYSLGVILYELLTGRLPFEGTMGVIFGQILYVEPPLPSTFVPGLNRDLDGICGKAMAKKSTERYPSMKAFAAALMDYLRKAPATDGDRNLVPTEVDKAAIVQTHEAAPGPPPAGKADIFQAATVLPVQRAAAPVPPRAVKPIPVAKPWSPEPPRTGPWRRPWVLGGAAGLVAILAGACFLATMPNKEKDKETPRKDLAPNKEEKPAPKTAVAQNEPLGMKFVKVPKGTFWMGWDSDAKESKQKQVSIAVDFELAAHTVTQAQWQEVMGDNPSHFSRKGGGKQSVEGITDEDLKRFPVENVSWEMVRDFLKKLNEREKGNGWLYRLPSEAEWEYACRGAATSKEECSFDFYLDKPGNDLSSKEANFNGDFPAGNGVKGQYLARPTKVGSYVPNKLGLYDMHGNVWQWCSDLWDGTGSDRVIRGGSWDSSGRYCRAYLRWYAPTSRLFNLGLRLARVSSGG